MCKWWQYGAESTKRKGFWVRGSAESLVSVTIDQRTDADGRDGDRQPGQGWMTAGGLARPDASVFRRPRRHRRGVLSTINFSTYLLSAPADNDVIVLKLPLGTCCRTTQVPARGCCCCWSRCCWWWWGPNRIFISLDTGGDARLRNLLANNH